MVAGQDASEADPTPVHAAGYERPGCSQYTSRGVRRGVSPQPDPPVDESLGSCLEWTTWFDELGAHLVDRGNPAFSQSIVGNCGPDTVLGGYTLIDAADLAEATDLAQRHPLVTRGGGVEIGELTVINAGRYLASDQ